MNKQLTIKELCNQIANELLDDEMLNEIDWNVQDDNAKKLIDDVSSNIYDILKEYTIVPGSALK